MGERFFIPLEPARFFEARPLQPHRAPDAPGLRFGAGCLGCGAPTQARAVLRAGLRQPSGPVAWEQPVPLCEKCAALQSALARGRARATAVALLGLGAGVLGGLLLGKGLGISPPVALSAGLLAAALCFLPARALAWWGLARLGWAARAGDGGEVALYFFRDPRQGEGAEFLCLEIEHEAQAEAFARLNPHAIPSARWEESYRAVVDGPSPPSSGA